MLDVNWEEARSNVSNSKEWKALITQCSRAGVHNFSGHLGHMGDRF